MTVRTESDVSPPWTGPDGVLAISWPDPASRNAIGSTVARRMARQLSYAADPRVRVVLLGADQSPFCSGWDVRDLAGLDTASRDDVAAYFEAGRELLRAIEGCPVPLVAAVSGVALGFGCSILAHCDLVIADRGATFGLPEVKRGFPPATVMPELLEAMDARVVGAWALTGARHDAGQARSAGLVDRVAETSALSAVVSEVLAELTSTDTAVLRQTKALLRALQACTLPQRRELGVAAATDHFCK